MKKKNKGCLSGDCQENLTKAESEVLYLITKDFLTPKQIQIRRKCSQQAVSKLINNLKKKGAYNRYLKEVVKSQPTITTNNQIRLHGQEFNIRIIYKDKRYEESRNKSNTIQIDGNTIRLYKETLEVYSGQSFYADSVNKATARSFKYWNRLFTRIEHDLKIILIKTRYQNIKLVNHHYAEINNELAQEVNINKDRIKIYAEEDGKLWFVIDDSLNLNEAETLHPETAETDMKDAVRPFFNGLRKSKGYTPELVLNMIAELVEDRKYYAENLRTHVGVIKELGKEVGKVAKGVKKLNCRIYQKKITDY